MPKMKKVGPTRGLGVRYGSTVRKRYMKVMIELKKPHRCPQCGFNRVRARGHRVRVSTARREFDAILVTDMGNTEKLVKC